MWVGGDDEVEDVVLDVRGVGGGGLSGDGHGGEDALAFPAMVVELTVEDNVGWEGGE